MNSANKHVSGILYSRGGFLYTHVHRVDAAISSSTHLTGLNLVIREVEIFENMLSGENLEIGIV